jgi:hypothetical protein
VSPNWQLLFKPYAAAVSRLQPSTPDTPAADYKTKWHFLLQGQDRYKTIPHYLKDKKIRIPYSSYGENSLSAKMFVSIRVCIVEYKEEFHNLKGMPH